MGEKISQYIGEKNVFEILFLSKLFKKPMILTASPPHNQLTNTASVQCEDTKLKENIQCSKDKDKKDATISSLKLQMSSKCKAIWNRRNKKILRRLRRQKNEAKGQVKTYKAINKAMKAAVKAPAAR